LSKPQPPAKASASTSTSSDYVVVAQVLTAHGLRGELKCRMITDFPRQRFRRGARVFIAAAPYTVVSTRVQGSSALLRLEEVQDRDAALALRGKDVEVPASDRLPLPRGRFYWQDVIGLTVVDATTGEMLGTVKDILETGANDVYIVQRPDAKDLLVPAIKDGIKKIDPSSGRMLIQPLPGLIP
jgi:16S rRNA processing protein RimM